MKCPSCGGETTSKFCPFCGSEMPKNGPDTVNYDNSSKRTVVVNNYYQGENNQQQSSPYIQQPAVNGKYVRHQQIVSDKDWSVTLILCIFLGWIGVHMFYVGKVGMGVVYVFTFGLFGIGWIVDIIKILCGAFSDRDGYKIKNI